MNEQEKQELELHPTSEQPEELTEEEKREILSVFSETNENKRRRTGFRMTIRNQIILIGSILVLAGLLLGAYYLFFKEPEPLPEFYALDARTEGFLDALEQKAEIIFCNRKKQEADVGSDPELYRIYTYASLYAERSGKVKLRFEPGDTYNGVRLECNGKTMQIPYADFYVSRICDQKTYGFDGEAMLTNALCVMTGKQELKLSVRPLDGFDEDGNDLLASGGIVMFPMVERKDIAMLEINNETGSYSIYQGSNGSFYFSGCELLTYDAELFASLLVDCRYVVTAGKVADQMDYAVYGLDSRENLTCSYMLLTQPDAKGEFDFHQVWIGKKSSSGSHYYAMYFGGRMDKQNNVIRNYASPRVFLIPYGNVEGNLSKPVESFFEAQLAGSITETEDLYKIEQVELEYLYYLEDKSDVRMKILNLPVLSFSDNISTNNSNASDILGDKKFYSDSKDGYADWTGEEGSKYLVGLTSSDGKPFSVSPSVCNIASDGVYTCTFGLAKDTDNAKYAALLPESLDVRYTTDGEYFVKLADHGLDFSAQAEDTVKLYSFTIESDEPVLQIELTFTMPNTVGYLVMDDIRVFADGVDAVPNDALTGMWRLVAPAEYVPEGKNYTYMDSTNFSALLQSIGGLKGDSVAKVGISRRGENQTDDILDQDALAEYGLDRPAIHVCYTYDGVQTDLYVSAYDEEAGCYYAYSTLTGDVYSNGKDVMFCNGIIARVLPSSVAWVTWNPLDFVDHSLVGMYVYEIREMEVTYAGKSYTFKVTADGKNITSVRYGDKELNEQNFRFFYLSIVRLNMKDAYVAQPEDQASEYLRIRIKTTSDEKEYVFYRVSSSRAYYTVNGDDVKYYCLFSSLRTVSDKLERFAAGETVER